MSGNNRMNPEILLGNSVQLVSVRIDGQSIGLPITAVRDVFVVNRFTPVPRADKAVMGLVNLRGHIVTILDLGSLLHTQRTTRNIGPDTIAVGVEWQGEVFGLIVDEIGDVLSLPCDISEVLPANISQNWKKLARRVHKLEKELMIEIDLQILLETMSLQAT